MDMMNLSDIEKRILMKSPCSENSFGDLPKTEVRSAIVRLRDFGLVNAPEVEKEGFFLVTLKTKGKAYLKEYLNA